MREKCLIDWEQYLIRLNWYYSIGSISIIIVLVVALITIVVLVLVFVQNSSISGSNSSCVNITNLYYINNIISDIVYA